MKQIAKYSFEVFFLIFFLLLINPGFGQDTTKVAPPDTVKITSADTTQLAVADTTVQKEKEDKKAKNTFVVYIGANVNQLSTSATTYDTGSDLGYDLGVSYRRGKFLYWGAGARYNNAVFEINDLNDSSDSSSLTVKSLDIPLTGGVDFLFFTSRVFTVRAFISVVPSFILGVGNDTTIDVQSEDLNSVVVYGQGGIGIDVLFFVIELGYNSATQNLFENDIKSRPSQGFVNLGFRF
ncbi:outer membrane beta-barrel protein [Algoriphagus sp. A40]|uniref:outer membrane beta-barrel protein n=1 Tax=Algoriphagus sp. A40 TaxID=1945863 RepID=UPI0009859A77|nr:outer membrane beta-barrel protein [Algoriphagus sp. A40]OOG70510.1 hypothetical protein B0E43_18065 [Algoriphagus sp. A40]